MCILYYKIFNTSQAYYVAKTALQNRLEIDESLGPYNVSYDRWFGVFRALMHGKIEEFEFHLSGNKATVISVVEVLKN